MFGNSMQTVVASNLQCELGSSGHVIFIFEDAIKGCLFCANVHRGCATFRTICIYK